MSLDDYDELDKRIITLLSKSSQGSYRQLAKQLDVHPTTLIQRIKNLENKGVINGYRASIDYMRLGYEFMGMVSIIADDIVGLQDKLAVIPEVIAVFDVSGDCDFIAWIACKNREEFSDTIKAINSIPEVRRTNTSVIFDILKDPFSYIPPM